MPWLPRATMGIGLGVNPNHDNAQKIYQALARFTQTPPKFFCLGPFAHGSLNDGTTNSRSFGETLDSYYW